MKPNKTKKDDEYQDYLDDLCGSCHRLMRDCSKLNGIVFVNRAAIIVKCNKYACVGTPKPIDVEKEFSHKTDPLEDIKLQSLNTIILKLREEKVRISKQIQYFELEKSLIEIDMSEEVINVKHASYVTLKESVYICDIEVSLRRLNKMAPEMFTTLLQHANDQAFNLKDAQRVILNVLDKATLINEIQPWETIQELLNRCGGCT